MPPTAPPPATRPPGSHSLSQPRAEGSRPPAGHSRHSRRRPRLDELAALCLTAPERSNRRLIPRLAAELRAGGQEPAAALALLAALIYARPDLLRAADLALLDCLEELWRSPRSAGLEALLAAALRGLVHTRLGPELAARLAGQLPPAELPAAQWRGERGETVTVLAGLPALQLESLRYLVSWHPEWLDLDRLIAWGAAASRVEAREQLLGEVIEPLLHDAPERFTPARLASLRTAFGATVRWRYFLAFLAAEPQAPAASRRRAAAWLPATLPYREAAHRLLGGGPLRLAVVQNLVFGQGDEMIRLAPILQGLLDGLPQLTVTLLTPRPYLYDHPRVRPLLISDPANVAVLSSGEFDGLIDLWEPEVDELNLSAAAHRAAGRLAERCRLRLRVEARLGQNHFAFQRVSLGGEEIGERLGLLGRTVRHIYDPARRLLVELGMPLRGEQGPHEQSLLVAEPSPEAEAEWRRMVVPDDGPGPRARRRPVALVCPFGGTREIKGFAADRPALLAGQLTGLVREGYRVVLLPNSKPWVTEELVGNVLAAMPVAERRHVAVAPDPGGRLGPPPGDDGGGSGRSGRSGESGGSGASGRVGGERPDLPHADRVMRWFKYFAARADLVVAVEGWLAHLGWQLGRPLRVWMAPHAYDEAWHPPARRRDQRIVSSLSPRAPRSSRPADLLGSRDLPPLPGRDRRELLIAALRGLGAAGRPSSEALLRRALLSADEIVRAAALAELGRLPMHDATRGLLLAELRSPDPESRGAAAEALLAAGVDATPDLGPHYRDILVAHVAILARAWGTVERLGEPALAALAVACQGRDDYFRREARWVMRAMLGERLLRLRAPAPT